MQPGLLRMVAFLARQPMRPACRSGRDLLFLCSSSLGLSPVGCEPHPLFPYRVPT
jgi:hypothetical protein